MSSIVSKAGVEAAPGDPQTPTPTVTHYDQVAANFSRALEELLAMVPHFVPAHPSTKGVVRTQKTVSDEFLVSMIAAVEETPGMLGLNQFDVTEARDSLQYGQAFRPMRDKLFAAATNLDFSINQRRADVVKPALESYQVIKGLARNAAGTLAASHAGNLRRDLGRAGRRKKKQPPQPTPIPPASTPVPPASTGSINKA